ncbi:ArsR family transcriptional regulator [Halobacterium salinarum]|nr:ArsR family transcriptional regulator [Halobacterium salinarum]MCF2166614.1 ArsR family transcriptional regulator [Halobacterium salinarum]MCF2238407.1 ArsR family transcriptional regulator [Halobacterium salinarum]
MWKTFSRNATSVETMPAPDSLFQLLAQRADLMRAVRDATTTTKPELADTLPVSRSTVDRAVRELEAHTLLERAGQVSLTLKGRLALRSYESFAADIDGLDAADAALATVPADARMDTVLFRDATVVNATSVAPQRATEAYRSLLADATRIEGYASAVLDSVVSTLRERIRAGELQVSLVLHPDVLDALVATHGDSVTDALRTDALTLREATTTLPYSLFTLDTTATTYACGLFYDDTGHTSLVHTDDAQAVAWADRVTADLRADATTLPK